MAPRDVIPKDAIRVVMEDLGLNKSIDQRLGFCPPKMSIAEKFVLAKRKMKQSKKFAGQSGTYTSPMTQAGYGTKADANRPSRTVHKPPALKGFQVASLVVNVPSLASAVSLNQLHVNELQSALVSRGLIGTSSGPGCSFSQLPRKVGAPFISDGRLNGSIYPLHVQANASRNHSTFSPQSLAVTKVSGKRGFR
ncbi:hypothetical protein MKX01_030397 [Papaver californicum]|nr:hypothetical protein MKX01_030397 [Papaver californicum]